MRGTTVVFASARLFLHSHRLRTLFAPAVNHGDVITDIVALDHRYRLLEDIKLEWLLRPSSCPRPTDPAFWMA